MNQQLWTADDLENMPTISASQFDDLKIDTAGMRIWLSRMTLADGAQFRRGVAIEMLRNGRWEIAFEYEGAK